MVPFYRRSPRSSLSFRFFTDDLPKPCRGFTFPSFVDFHRLDQSKPAKFRLDRVLVVKVQVHPILCAVTVRAQLLDHAIRACALRDGGEDHQPAITKLTGTVQDQFSSPV